MRAGEGQGVLGISGKRTLELDRPVCACMCMCTSPVHCAGALEGRYWVEGSHLRISNSMMRRC